MNLVEKFKVVTGTHPVTTNGAVTGDYISLKDAHRVTVIFLFTQAVGHATVCGINRATAVAPTGAVAMDELVPIWVNEDTGASDTLVKATSDANTETLTDDVANKMVVFEIDPAKLTDTFDVIAGTVTNSSQATNFVSITYIIHTRYPQATPPSAITD